MVLQQVKYKHQFQNYYLYTYKPYEFHYHYKHQKIYGKGNIVNIASIYGEISPDPKIYLDGDWEDSGVVFIRPQFQASAVGVIVDASVRGSQSGIANVAQDTVVTVFGINNSQNTNNTDISIYNSTTTTEPQAGALMYIKDLEIKTYRLFG